jgi:hypothetical protein
MTLAWDPTTLGLQIVLTLGGTVFGGAAPPPQSLTAYLRGNGFGIAGSSAAFGSYNVTITPTGGIAGTLTGISNPFVSGGSVAGQIYGSTFAISYTLSLVGGGQAKGIVFLTKTS